jgi:hypothetical protein
MRLSLILESNGLQLNGFTIKKSES